jgi:hypothetical protein
LISGESSTVTPVILLTCSRFRVQPRGVVVQWTNRNVALAAPGRSRQTASNSCSSRSCGCADSRKRDHPGNVASARQCFFQLVRSGVTIRRYLPSPCHFCANSKD